MEHSSLSAGEQRIKFSCQRVGGESECANLASRFSKEISDLARALTLLEELGAAPVLPDGKVGGNGAMLVGDSPELMIVSRSGKAGGTVPEANDFCFVTSFDAETWSARYFSCDEATKPSSDTPLLWTALHQTGIPTPVVALHGHAIATVEEADQLGIPISEEETLFSTPADTEALQTLFTSHPYPKTNVYIRKGHGFFLLHQKVSGACAQLRALVVSSDASHKQAPRG